uniref:Uncharacterized protein n=1 Tax=Haemonchus contortus TaxID=6289 RepID=A0A912M6Z9_HAECO
MWAEKEYTCARSAFSVPNLQIFIPFKLRRLVLTIIFVCCIALVISIASVIASHKFLRENSSMSQKTKQMQKRFLRSLFIQESETSYWLFSDRMDLWQLQCLYYATHHIENSSPVL